MFDYNFFKYQEIFVDFTILISIVLTIIIILGFYTVPIHHLLDIIDLWFSIYISIFIFYRFNPYKKDIIFTNLDRKIIFRAGIYIFTSAVIDGILASYKQPLNDIIHLI